MVVVVVTTKNVQEYTGCLKKAFSEMESSVKSIPREVPGERSPGSSRGLFPGHRGLNSDSNFTVKPNAQEYPGKAICKNGEKGKMIKIIALSIRSK